MSEERNIINDAIFLKSLLRTDLKSFIIKSFYTLNFSTKYVDNWHIDAIVDYLYATTNGDITRLIINMPPRYLKSLCVNVAWSAWLLGRNPTNKIISASYSEKISTKHSLDSRYIITSEWYKHLFPQTIISDHQNTKDNFRTNLHGFRLATSVNGSLTGEGGDYLILDDPINPIHANNKSIVETTMNWFEKIFMTRLNNRQKGAVVVIMQRLHEDDLSGYLIKKGGWEHLNLPVIAEKKTIISIKEKKYYREKDAILHKDYQNRDIVNSLKREIGSYNFFSQYQQNPISRDGELFKREWIKFYKINECPQKEVVLSWDTASTTKANSAYSVCTVWTSVGKNFYLLDIYKEKIDYPTLKEKFFYLKTIWNPKTILVEDCSSGQQIIQELKNQINITGIKPVTGKTDRFVSILKFFENGNIFFPNNASWLSELIDELISFPNNYSKDIIDSITQYLNWSKVYHAPSIKIL